MSKADGRPAYSEHGLENRPLFFAGCNNVNIYVEDTDKEYVYEQILERLFENGLRFQSIFPLNGKQAVLARCRINGAYEPNGTPNIYIVDGDFDNLWDEQKENLPGLIYLTRYNIESYYCCEDAVISCLRMRLCCRRDQVEAILHYREWEDRFFEEAAPLFILFALVKKNLPKNPNVSISVKRFLDQCGHTKAEEAETYQQEIIASLGDIAPYIEAVEAQIAHRFAGTRKEQLQALICGKYELTSLCRHIRTVFGIKKLSDADFQRQMILLFDLAPLAFLRDFIQAQMRHAEVPGEGIA